MRLELEKTNIEVDHELSNDFSKILNSANDADITPFMKLFWEQQKKLFSSSSKGVRYHPMIIRFCLSLAAKSPSCYEELRNSKVFFFCNLLIFIYLKKYLHFFYKHILINKQTQYITYTHTSVPLNSLLP